MIIAPSILAADFGRLKEEIEMVNKSQADWFHIDVMDGVFVPNISFGFPVMEVLANYAKKPLDVHLMIVNPEKYVERFIDYGIHALSVHHESTMQIHRTLEDIKKHGVKTGIALNPGTHENTVEPLTDLIDFVNLMTVNPGFGGQQFIGSVKTKILNLNKLKNERGLEFEIELDGGVTDININELEILGADIFVMGTAFFKNENPTELVERLKNT